MIELNSTFFAQILNFLILVILLRAVAYKPVLKILKEREDRIAASIDKADADAAEAAKTLEAYKAELAGARTKAQEIMDLAEKRASEEHEASIQATKREIEQMKKSIEKLEESIKEDQSTLENLTREAEYKVGSDLEVINNNMTQIKTSMNTKGLNIKQAENNIATLEEVVASIDKAIEAVKDGSYQFNAPVTSFNIREIQ